MSNDVYIVEEVEDVDGGYLPDNHRVVGVFSSLELAERYAHDNEGEFDINKWEIDEE